MRTKKRKKNNKVWRVCQSTHYLKQTGEERKKERKKGKKERGAYFVRARPTRRHYWSDNRTIGKIAEDRGWEVGWKNMDKREGRKEGKEGSDGRWRGVIELKSIGKIRDYEKIKASKQTREERNQFRIKVASMDFLLYPPFALVCLFPRSNRGILREKIHKNEWRMEGWTIIRIIDFYIYRNNKWNQIFVQIFPSHLQKYIIYYISI